MEAPKHLTKPSGATTLVIDDIEKMTVSSNFFEELKSTLRPLPISVGNLNIVFVTTSSDLQVVDAARCRSEWSRRSVFEVGDISDDEAVTFLSTHGRLDRNVAVELVQDVTGGRCGLIVEAEKRIAAGQTVADIQREKETKTQRALFDAGVKHVPNAPLSFLYKQRYCWGGH